MQLIQLQRTANQREAVQSSWVELRRRRYRHFADATQLNSTRRRVELCRYKGALKARRNKAIITHYIYTLSDVRSRLLGITRRPNPSLVSGFRNFAWQSWLRAWIHWRSMLNLTKQTNCSNVRQRTTILGTVKLFVVFWFYSPLSLPF